MKFKYQNHYPVKHQKKEQELKKKEEQTIVFSNTFKGSLRDILALEPLNRKFKIDAVDCFEIRILVRF